MKGRRLLLCVAATALGSSTGWALPAWYAQVERPPEVTAPPRPFRATYRITWSGVTAARAEIVSTLPADSEEVRTVLKTATAGMARSLWQMDATHLAIADRRTARPIRVEETDRREKKDIASRVEFAADGATRWTRTTRKGSPAAPAEPAPRRFEYPDLLDMHCALLALRNVPLAAGESHTLLVMTVTNPYVVTFKVLGRETVEVEAGKRAAIRCSLGLSKVDKSGALQPQKKLKAATVWIADDPDRALLKVEAKVVVGSVVLELESISLAP